MEQSIKSQRGGKVCNVEFENRSSCVASMYWHDFEGQKVKYDDVRPNGTYGMKTYEGHPWSAQDPATGKILSINNNSVFYPRHSETVFIDNPDRGGQYQAGYQQGQPPQHGQYYQQQYQHYQQPSQQYGDYGNYFQQSVFSTNAWQAFQFQTPNELQQVFQMELQKNPANGRRQAIQAEDLCNIMNNCHTIRNFFRCHEGYINWSRELCSIMLSMLDRSGDGFMQWNEFQELQQCLVQWYQMFKQFDHDGSGYIEANELVNIVRTQFKYNLTPQSIETLLKRYSRVIMWGGQEKCLIAFDDFVSVSVRLRAYTDAFRKRDQLQNGGDSGTCTFAYDDFIRCVMCL